MISEKNFAREFTSFWKEHTPWFNDFYSSEVSLGSKMAPRIEIQEHKDHVYVNNVIAETHFHNIQKGGDYCIDDSFNESIPTIDAFSQVRRKGYKLTDDYKKLIGDQARRLASMYSGPVTLSPEFPGCGILTNCRGDLLQGSKLIEIKAARDRQRRASFRPEDFRQLLIYCALNYLAGDIYIISDIELVNPRRGIKWTYNLEKFIRIISDNSSNELFEIIGEYLTDMADHQDFGSMVPDGIY